MNIKFPKLTLLSIILLQAISACSPSAQNVEGEKWVAFSQKKAEELNIAEWYIEPGTSLKYWSPTESDINALESGLASYLQEKSDRFFTEDVPVWERLDQYNRQYAGMVIEGKNIIYANYFCNSMGLDWRNEFVTVMDGGDCFFQFMYDVGAGEFFDLQVNGSA